MRMEEIKERVKAIALYLYETEGIKPECEECFYLTDPECPDFPHVCALEKALEDPEERKWVLENIPDKVEMRRRWREKHVRSINRNCR